MDVPVEINRRLFDYDQVIIVGPVFPHEVVGFSGGNKYLFPGVAGPQILNFFHWLGAVVTNPMIIGNKWTPVRKVVDRAGAHGQGDKALLLHGGASAPASLAGLFAGHAGGGLGSRPANSRGRLHIVYKDRPFHTILSCAPPMYDELWVGGQMHVQARAGAGRRRRTHHLRAAHHGDFRHPRPDSSRRSAITAAIIS